MKKLTILFSALLIQVTLMAQIPTGRPSGGAVGGSMNMGHFYGKVVDLFYFPIWEGNLPSWLPFWGGKFFTFFNAIFNVADMAISTGVGILIVFNKKAFPKTQDSE